MTTTDTGTADATGSTDIPAPDGGTSASDVRSTTSNASGDGRAHQSAPSRSVGTPEHLKGGTRTPAAMHNRRLLLDALGHAAKLRASAEALEAQLLAASYEHCRELTAGHGPDAFEQELKSLAAEIGAVTRTSDRTVAAKLNAAPALEARYPRTADAWGQGAISTGHVRVIESCGDGLTRPESIRAYEELVVAKAHETTPGRLRVYAKRVAADLEPEETEQRLRQAQDDRRVWVQDEPDGMCQLSALLPAVVGAGIFDRLTQTTKQLHGPGRDEHDARTFEQTRADVLADLLLTGQVIPGSPNHVAKPIQATVAITVPAISLITADHARATGSDTQAGDFVDDSTPAIADPTTAVADSAGASTTSARTTGTTTAGEPTACAGEHRDDAHSEHTNTSGEPLSLTAFTGPAELAGRTPIPIHTALELCGNTTTWYRVLTDPLDGTPLTADTYRPPAALRRLLQIRDVTCVAPGCRRLAKDCDIDHTTPWAAGGPTKYENLAVLCRGHHTMREAGWVLEQDGPGRMVWISPTGQRFVEYEDHVAPGLRTAGRRHRPAERHPGTRHADQPPDHRHADQLHSEQPNTGRHQPGPQHADRRHAERQCAGRQHAERDPDDRGRGHSVRSHLRRSTEHRPTPAPPRDDPPPF
ncbi:HNH endonuclease signature motif containing protein [Gulosibacter sp. 10]|uniref:HNH endonuclease signature motif containing protein n=1 Tax=Gulosibacter sp. 10 TaxID=1255570 RepID=UPI00097F0CE3|nr:HNH endonuclease signature motif containing protein [Gulosibacter sp. 10]SJM67096.1 CONSERVED 13E12 REPEAT FAMILY PROTEIN [Gulosibacter sp. 10]